MSDPLLTDQYTLAMAQSFWRHGQAEDLTTFELAVRSLPRSRSYLVVAGLEQALAYLQHLRFRDRDLAFLSSLEAFDPAFLEYLKRLKFRVSVRAISEGTIVAAQVPIFAVTASRAEASIVEPALLAIINHQTMVASKAARIVSVAGERPVWDFSLRRLHGVEAGVATARAAYIAGCAGTATVAAGREYGIPTSGTMAHHFVQSFGPDREKEAFAQFLRDYPEKNVLLVDTFDTLTGIENAIAAAEETGIVPGGIRIDSGDIATLARYARARLDQAGYRETSIIASSDLDEHKIRELIRRGAPVDAFGVGTMLGTSADAPNLTGVYKLTWQQAQGDLPEMVMKTSTDKETDPGVHQVWRRPAKPDLIALIDEAASDPEAQPLLDEVMRDGHLLRKHPTLEEIRLRFRGEMAALDPRVRDIDSNAELSAERSDALLKARNMLSQRLKSSTPR